MDELASLPRSLHAVAQWGRERREDDPGLLIDLGLRPEPSASVVILHRLFKRLDAAVFKPALGEWRARSGIAPEARLTVDGTTLRCVDREEIPGAHGVEQVVSQRARQMQQPIARSGWGRMLVNAFILWHLFALTIWLLPESQLRRNFIGLVSPYMTSTGLMQSWAMFAPNPPSVDVFVEARIAFANGQVRDWSYPRLGDPGLLDWYRNERFYKLIENGHMDENRMVWPSLARYAARRNNSDPRNPPVSVALVRHFGTIPPPGGSFGPYQAYAFYGTPILPQDLR
jgi:hypothetical protein